MTLYQKYPLKLYNTLHRKLEEFTPISPPNIGLYVCGPTVYGPPHLGHARGAITFDVVYRYFTHLGYKVRYVRNITDVGHLEDETTEQGEDKISKRAKLEQLEPMEVVQLYTNCYRQAMEKLNVLPPSIEPTATGHIIEQVELIEKLIKKGWAYEVEGSVYFDIQKYSEKHRYGELSGKILEDLQSGSRDLAGQDGKRSPFDFALWKNATDGHLMKWRSPWGEGFPGWHLECTAMSAKYLGVPFDIHGGGMDLQFPHHECEIAQSFGVHDQAPVRYWMHNNMLTINGQKMSKSLGNFINLEDLFCGNHEMLEQAYSPMTIRFFILQAHYGSNLDFSNEALQAAEKGFQKLVQAQQILGHLEHPGKANPDEAREEQWVGWIDKCYASMGADFNTAQTIATLFEMSSAIQTLRAQPNLIRELSEDTFRELKETFIHFFSDILGLAAEASRQDGKLAGVMDLVIQMRNNARQEKNYSVSDQIRDTLGALGISLKDEKDGRTTFTVEG